MKIEPPSEKPRWGMIAAVVILTAGAAVLLFFILHRPQLPSALEVKSLKAGAEIYSPETKTWVPLRQGQVLQATDKIRTGPVSEVDLQIPDQLQLRLKENSEIEGQTPGFFDSQPTSRLKLPKGRILGSTEKQFQKRRLEITTPVLVAAVRGTQFQVESDPETKQSGVDVLRGVVEVKSLSTQKEVLVKGLEKTKFSHGEAPKTPTKISREDWDRLKEIYELTVKSAAFEAQQMDLSKKAGSLFGYVFDHGTFYTPDTGFADREFSLDPQTGEVTLQLRYDVFPANCFVGMYMKTRDLDFSKFKSLSFEARGDKEEGWPAEFRIEVKSKTGLVAAYTPKNLNTQWQPFRFPIRLSRTMPVTEIVFVVSNVKVGSDKKGSVYFRNVSLNAE